MGPKEITNIFELAFEVPFKCVFKDSSTYEVGPTSDGKFLFHFLVTFPRQVRLNIEFTAEPFGISYVKTLGTASPQQKASFIGFVSQIIEKKAKVNLLINGIPSNPMVPDDWSTNWGSLMFSVTKTLFLVAEGQDPIEGSMPFVLLAMGAILSLTPIEEAEIPSPSEIGSDSQLSPQLEGSEFQVVLNRYERSPVNRMICLMEKGYKCAVCGMDFESAYGEIGKSYIQVHHVVPVSQLGPNYHIDPSKDLVPVCPNCHAMLHRRNPPYSVEELKEIIKKKDEK